MELRDVIGYLFVVLAVAGTVTGIWAAWRYSPPRVYARQLARERRALRKARVR